MKYSIGVDIGGTKIAVGIVSEYGDVQQIHTIETPKTSNIDILKKIKESVIRLESFAKNQEIPLIGIGIGTAGQVDYKKGIIVSGTSNMKDWNKINLKELFSEITTLPLYLDNDVNAFCMAEYKLGIGKKYTHLVCVSIGTGVGGGIIADGKLLHGSWGGAGELGHVSVNFKGPKCNCGSRGCIETYASGTGIVNQFYKEYGYYITAEEVFSSYHNESKEGKQIIFNAVEALTVLTNNLVNIFNPEAIVFGGGVIENNKWLVKEVEKNVRKIGMSSLIDNVDLHVSELGYYSGLIGAAAQVWYSLSNE